MLRSFGSCSPSCTNSKLAHTKPSTVRTDNANNKASVLNPACRALREAFDDDVGAIPPEETVARLPGQMTGWRTSDRIDVLWHLVQYLDDCLGQSLFQPGGVAIFDAFARARSRAMLFLQKEIDALPNAMKADGALPSGAPVGTRLH